MRPRAVVDICGTIADVGVTLEPLLGPRPDLFKYHWPGATPEYLGQHLEVYAEAEPVHGASEGLERLVRAGWEIIYLTARPEKANRVTREWLRKHGFPAGPVIHTEKKAWWAARLGAILAVEDSPAEIEALKPVLSRVLVKSQPYNQGFPCRFEWESVAGKPAAHLTREGICFDYQI